jgi:hypothetical protein
VTKSPITKESAKETVKTIARGMPGVSGVTVVTNSYAFYFCIRGCGRAERPAFPALSHPEGNIDASLGRTPRREADRACLFGLYRPFYFPCLGCKSKSDHVILRCAMSLRAPAWSAVHISEISSSEIHQETNFRRIWCENSWPPRASRCLPCLDR